ncbi:HlyD family secretion protein [Pseudoalteromonas piscicida]|uniref:HlyD family secretion protein n=1 Tax=Pseudoalteromonas piscicida TaxID=43662 RepID=UPI0030A1795D
MKTSFYILSFILLTLLAGCSEPNSKIFGIIERPQVQISSPSGEMLIELMVKRGDKVVKGQALAKIDDIVQQQQVHAIEQKIRRLQAQYQLLLSGARIEQVKQAKARVHAAQAVWREAQRQLARQRQLIKDELTSQDKVDAASAYVESTLGALQEAQERLQELENGTREETIEQAKIAISEAQTQLVIAKKQLADLTLKAPRSGIVEDLPWLVGERPVKGAPIILLAADDQTLARLYLPQTQLAKVSLGSVLNVHLGGSDKSLKGTVSYISQSASFTPYFALSQEERARLMYVVEVELTDNVTAPSGTPVWMELPL